MGTPIDRLPAFDDSLDEINVIIECPQGSGNKYAYEPDKGLFLLKGILPLGATFPFDFGFIPGTVGGDGDPLDVLVLMDEPAFPGCLLRARPVGVIQAEQTEGDKTERNDRLIAVASVSRTQLEVKTINDVDPVVIEQIEHFFISYNEEKGKVFRPLGRFGAVKAKRLIEEAVAALPSPHGAIPP